MPSRISLRKHWISPPLRTRFDRFLKENTLPGSAPAFSCILDRYVLIVNKMYLFSLFTGMILKPIKINCLSEINYRQSVHRESR